MFLSFIVYTFINIKNSDITDSHFHNVSIHCNVFLMLKIPSVLTNLGNWIPLKVNLSSINYTASSLWNTSPFLHCQIEVYNFFTDFVFLSTSEKNLKSTINSISISKIQWNTLKKLSQVLETCFRFKWWDVSTVI